MGGHFVHEGTIPCSGACTAHFRLWHIHSQSFSLVCFGHGVEAVPCQTPMHRGFESTDQIVKAVKSRLGAGKNETVYSGIGNTNRFANIWFQSDHQRWICNGYKQIYKHLIHFIERIVWYCGPVWCRQTRRRIWE